MPDLNKIKLPNMILVLSMMVLVVVATFGATFAYFKAKLFNLESSQTLAIAGGKMEITFNGAGTEGNTGNIVANGIVPGWKTTKVFTLTGENETDTHGTNVDNKMYYKVGIVVEQHTFSSGSFYYNLTADSSSSTNGKMVGDWYDVINSSGTTWIGNGYFDVTTKPENHKYNLEISYPDNGEDQSGNNGKAFKAYVTVDTVHTDNIVQLSIDLDGGTFTNSQSTTLSLERGNTITLPEPRKEGHVFTGWTANGAIVSKNQITVNYSNATVTATYREANNFESDTWAEIAANVANGTALTRYKVGDTREISLKEYTNIETDSDGKYTIRVANNSNYDCTLESKTACGFVVEFQDIITTYRMNAAKTSAGGWPASEMRSFVNDLNDTKSIINSLPSELRAVIADTTVVSGHGNISGETNFTSTDKLYLLSTTEVWGNCIGATNNSAVCSDYAAQATITRQLDYYANLGVVSTDSTKRQGAIKQLNGSNIVWWLRSANSNNDYYFRYVSSSGSNDSYSALGAYGVAPAFRIG